MKTPNADFLKFNFNMPPPLVSVSRATDSVDGGDGSSSVEDDWLSKRQLQQRKEMEERALQQALIPRKKVEEIEEHKESTVLTNSFPGLSPSMPTTASFYYFGPDSRPTVNIDQNPPSKPPSAIDTPPPPAPILLPDKLASGDTTQKTPSDSENANIQNLADMNETMRSFLREVRDFKLMKQFMIMMNSLSLRTQNPQFIHSATWSISSLLSGVFAILFILAVNVFWTVYVHVWDNVIPSQLFFVSDMLVVMTTLGVYKATTSLFGWRKRTGFLFAFVICAIMSCVKPNVKYFDSTVPDLFNHIPRNLLEKHMFSLDRNFNVMTPIVQINKLRTCHDDRDHPECLQALADIFLYMPKYDKLVSYMGERDHFGLPETVYSMRLAENVHSEGFVGGNSENKFEISFNLHEVRKLEHKKRVTQLLPFLHNRFRNGLYLEHVYKDSVSMYNTFRHGLSVTTSVWNVLDKSYVMFWVNPLCASLSRLITMFGMNGINFILTTQDLEIYFLDWINYWHYVVNHKELPHHRVNFSLFLTDAGLNRRKDLARVENNTFDMCTFHPCVTAHSITSHNVKIATMTQNLKKKISADQHAELLNMTANDKRLTKKILKELEKENTCPYQNKTDEDIASILHECPNIIKVSLLIASNEIADNPALTSTMCPQACLNTYMSGCAPIVEDLDNSTPTLHKEEKMNTEDPEDSQPLPDFSWWAYMETVLGYFVVFLQHSLSMGFGYMWAVLFLFACTFLYTKMKHGSSGNDFYRDYYQQTHGFLTPSHVMETPSGTYKNHRSDSETFSRTSSTGSKIPEWMNMYQ